MQEINTAVPIDEKNKVKFTINHLFYIAEGSPHANSRKLLPWALKPV